MTDSYLQLCKLVQFKHAVWILSLQTVMFVVIFFPLAMAIFVKAVCQKNVTGQRFGTQNPQCVQNLDQLGAFFFLTFFFC